MKKRFKNIFAKTRKKNRLAVLICTIILTVSMGTLAGCSIAKESAEDVPGQPETEDTKKMFRLKISKPMKICRNLEAAFLEQSK